MLLGIFASSSRSPGDNSTMLAKRSANLENANPVCIFLTKLLTKLPHHAALASTDAERIMSSTCDTPNFAIDRRGERYINGQFDAWGNKRFLYTYELISFSRFEGNSRSCTERGQQGNRLNASGASLSYMD